MRDGDVEASNLWEIFVRNAVVYIKVFSWSALGSSVERIVRDGLRKGKWLTMMEDWYRWMNVVKSKRELSGIGWYRVDWVGISVVERWMRIQRPRFWKSVKLGLCVGEKTPVLSQKGYQGSRIN